MKNYVFKSLFWVLFIFLANFSILNAQSASGIDVNLNVGGCNNNGICEVGNEDIFSCPADCTPVIPPTPPGGGGGGGGSTIGYFFKDLRVTPSYNSVIIEWKSTVPTMSNLKWGTNPDYKDGVVSNVNFLLDHRVEITNLNPGTVYYFSIQAESNLGITSSLSNQSFTTLISPDTTPPGNPTNVKAISSTAGITVSWKNPKDKDFDYIRVMRNDDRYYASPLDGRLVYEGTGNYFTDANVIEGHKYFYSLFARDKNGNYSSGALVSIIHNPSNSDKWKEPVVIPSEGIEPLSDIFIINQNSLTYDFYPGNIFSLSGDASINIKTNYSSKEKDDDMWVEIRNADGVIISQYFFSRTKDKDNFINVIIPSFDKGGYYRITVYKYNNGVAQLVNYGSFEISKTTKSTSTLSFWYIFWLVIIVIFILLILFLLFFILIPRIFRRFRKDKENEEYIIKEIRGEDKVQ